MVTYVAKYGDSRDLDMGNRKFRLVDIEGGGQVIQVNLSWVAALNLAAAFKFRYDIVDAESGRAMSYIVR